MNVVGMIQARMTSTRLPGKVLKRVLGKPLLEYEIERLKRIKQLNELIVATTTNEEDDPVVELCDSLGVPTYRGSELDVLSRYHEAAEAYRADVVARFTADCPLIDPAISGELIGHYLSHRDELDYCITDARTYPHGIDTEVFSREALGRAFRKGHSKQDREHVTYYIRTRPREFRIWEKPAPHDWSAYRLTVDTPEDFVLVKAVIEKIYPENPDFYLQDVISVLCGNPELLQINEMVRHREIDLL